MVTHLRLQYMASRGHRVIGCAQYLLSEDKYPTDYAFSKKDKNYPDSEYCFLGLISLEDPPKHGVREAIGTLRLAGIRVMMVTGELLIHDYLSFSHRSSIVVFLRRRSPQDRRSNCP
jgi:magnesium-transporting ATPase (P-type)